MHILATMLFVPLALIGCTSVPVVVSDGEVTDGLARFVVENRSERDVATASFVVTFTSAFGDPVRVDTIDYERTMDFSGAEQPFVRAEAETFFNVSVPAGVASATAVVLQITFPDGSIWPPV